MAVTTSSDTSAMDNIEVANRELPPPPPISTRPSLPFVIFGNLALVAMILAYLTEVVPLGFLVAAVIIAFFIAAYVVGSRDTHLRQWYLSGRTAELRPLFDTEAEAAEQARLDLTQSLELNPTFPWIAIPMLLLCLAVAIALAIDANNSMASLIWVLRWPLALICGFGGLLFIGGIWVAANTTPAPIEAVYTDLRTAELTSERLSAEDQNDIHIINEVASLESLHRRIETYTLESALLSALSFSSFVSIIASDRPYKDSLKTILPPPISWEPLGPIPIPLIGDLKTFPVIPIGYFIDHVVELIGLSLLLCATTFLGVLIARLRFNEGYRDAQSLLRAAERLNEKEDQAQAGGDSGRVAVYSRAINAMLQKAAEVQEGLRLTVMQMRVSRDAGILFFVVTLCLCGLLFNLPTAQLIALLFILVFVFGHVDRFARRLLLHRIFNEGSLAAVLKPFARRR